MRRIRWYYCLNFNLTDYCWEVPSTTSDGGRWTPPDLAAPSATHFWVWARTRPFQPSLSLDSLIQLFPKCHVNSSDHLVRGRPLLRLPLSGTQVVRMWFHLFLGSRITCPAYLYLSSLANPQIFLALVFSKMVSTLVLSTSLIPIIFLSILFWVVWSFFICLLVVAQVCAPYVNTGIIAVSYTHLTLPTIYSV